jgi:hypothetical protein
MSAMKLLKFYEKFRKLHSMELHINSDDRVATIVGLIVRVHIL